MFLYVAGHSIRVAMLAYRISKNAGHTRRHAIETFYAALLHDIGKFKIAKTIITAPRKLTADEYEEVKRHTKIGYQKLVKKKGKLNRIAAEVALYHHERNDGSGYYSKTQEEISDVVKIIAIADVYDALTNNRPYKTKTHSRQALIYMCYGCRELYEAKYLGVLCSLKLKDEPEIRPLKYKQEEI